MICAFKWLATCGNDFSAISPAPAWREEAMARSAASLIVSSFFSNNGASVAGIAFCWLAMASSAAKAVA